MKDSNTQIEQGIPQGFRTERQSMHLDRFDSASAAATARPPSLGAFIRRPSSVGHARDAYRLSLFPALEIPRFRTRSLDALSCKFSLPSVPLKTRGIGWNISGNGFSLVGLI
jgi:hypothetical protein